ncbi:P-type DNA transfer ATPase VirB11 [Salmonella enterica subsp. enterica]|uniref:Type IV secretion system protein n=2 Tax=Salmonella enterica TaxID=28901 RepID=A0A5V1MQC4_SALER|nr:P-type DNA transfer ATPase VirB11 [Salmonella enterica subsp. enterica]EAU6995360.1 P-type DNA transfer ATPase VirB11 [Salmonella enterica]EBG5081918.1 P-type DNA transfer ATPase VirB11 [Salmonella enterica subsp. enterica serovar Adelaide]EBQ9152558.1 P-type DNA transfer ATPase VirB11 [Salmonella enterica subsp. enterica serovar Obogu]EBY7405855.1 P-type DNA transfer ATPase VirB11 [Salmonella enterica subsp. enterica serovar Pomona]ECE0110976.1 P-type DNA transfer ATPase VirB11 [Salmonella
MSFDNATLARDFLKQSGVHECLNREGVRDVAINRPGEIWFENENGWVREERPTLDLSMCNRLANALAAYNNQSLTVKSPIKTVELPDNERGLIVMAPACEPGTLSMTFRKPSNDRYTLQGYIDSGRFSETLALTGRGTELEEWQISLKRFHAQKDWLNFFMLAVERRLNIIIFGGTGSGKTTFAKSLVDLFPVHRRMLTIEAVNELKMPYHPNHVHLIYGDIITPKELVSCSLRMKPDHIFLAELTGDEAWDFMELLNTGHPGTITTAHANDTLSGYGRVCGMIKQSPVGMGLDYEYIERRVRTSFDIVLYMEHTRILEVHYEPETKLRLLNAAR